jgi:hypothetical protein
VGDDRDAPAAGDLTGLAVRAQPVSSDRRGQRRIRAGEPELEQLVEHYPGSRPFWPYREVATLSGTPSDSDAVLDVPTP